MGTKISRAIASSTDLHPVHGREGETDDVLDDLQSRSRNESSSFDGITFTMLTLLTIAAIPTVIGTSEGISEQKKQAAEAKRAAKFHLLATWQNDPNNEADISAALVVVRDGKVSPKSSRGK